MSDHHIPLHIDGDKVTAVGRGGAMSAAHTPGPWVALHDHLDANTAKSLAYIRPVARPDDFYMLEIASVFGCDTEPYQAANARLIAAAPDLLAALQELHALVVGECPSLLNEDSSGNAGLDLEIRAAIAKAGAA